MNRKIYLDYNASAPIRPEALTAMQNALTAPLNASAIHHFGREGRKIVETARTQIANIINAPTANQLIFNSGATEANNTVLKHFPQNKILLGATEHVSVLDAAPAATQIPVDTNGLLDLDALETLLKEKQIDLISVMIINNETGVIQPIQQISALVKNHGALLHCDAAQALGRIPLDMQKLGIDFLTLSAHKCGGPQGVGALALGLCGITPTLLHGGGQEKSARAGTENVAGIAGFAAAATAANQNHEILSPPPTQLRDKLENWVMSNKYTAIHGQNAPRAYNTTFFSIEGIKSETAIMAMDLEGLAISNGSACSSGTVKPSHVLKAMGADDTTALSGIRISTGWNTTENDIDIFIEKFETFLKRTQK